MKTKAFSRGRILVLIAFISLFATSAITISAQSAIWEAFTTANDEFSAAIPPGAILLNEDRNYPRLVFSSAEVRIDVNRRKNFGEADSALAIRAAPRDRGTETEFELGKVVGHVNVSERSNRYSTVIYASSKKFSYFIGVYARTKDAALAKQFLSSLKFSGSTLFNIPGVEAPAAQPNKLEDMPSSEIVKKYLDVPTNKRAPVRFEPLDTTIKVYRGPEEIAEADQSVETRSMIVLRMPLPTPISVRPYGRATVPVVVTLLASGEVGSVVVDSKTDRGLAESAANAAKQIKFIPAEVDGKLVDTRRIFVYSFTSR